MISAPESSMAFGGAITILAAAQILKSFRDLIRRNGRRPENSQQFGTSFGLPALLLFAGLILIGIGLRDFYGQPLQRIWPFSTFWS